MTVVAGSGVGLPPDQGAVKTPWRPESLTFSPARFGSQGEIYLMTIISCPNSEVRSHWVAAESTLKTGGIQRLWRAHSLTKANFNEGGFGRCQLLNIDKRGIIS